MSESNELHTITTLDEQPFKHFCVTIGELPTSFIDSMSYYELAAWLCQYLQSTVIPAVNENAAAVTELQQLYIELHNYVENYFENLDVQQEINHKLDAMAENGTLTELIGNYVDPKLYSFQTEINAEIEQQNNIITNQNTAIDEISNLVNSVAGSNPIPVTSTSDMTDTSKIYVLTTNGYWYYYDGDSWEQGGLFQSAQDSNLLDENVYLRDQMLGNIVGKNLLNQSSEFIITGKYLSNTALVDSTNYRCSHPILVKAGLSYTFTTVVNMGNNKARYAYVDSNLSVLSIYNATADDEAGTASFTAPTDGYVIINLYRNQTPVVFSKTADYTSTLQYNYKNEHLTVDISKSTGKLPLDNLAYFSRSVNLFNKDSNLIIKGKYIGSSGLTDNSSHAISHPIYFTKGDVVRWTFTQTMGNNNKYGKCTVDGEYIESYSAEAESGVATATIPATGYYFFNLGSASNYDTYMIVVNTSYPSEFVAFNNTLDNVHIPYIDAELANMPATTSPIYGKKIGLTGDSICAGAGYAGGYGKILHDEYDMTVQNIGVGGGTIASGTVTDHDTNRFWINESISSLDANCDYVIVEGGVNDSGLEVPLGFITEGYNDTLDTNTYYGAFENMLKQLITRFAGKKYAYLAVHQMTVNYRVTNNENSSYYWASKKCCEKWGVPFIDINSQAPAFGLFRNTMGDLYVLRQTYTKDGDGWHPNEDGYKKYYMDKIVAGLEAL